MVLEKKLGTEVKQILVAVFICYFFTGAAGLIYEVIWTRMLTLVFGSTTFATSTVLAAFMGGLALGSIIFGRIADRIKRPLQGYALLEIGVGLSALIVPFLFQIVQPFYLGIARQWQFSFSYNIFLFLLCLFLLLLPTTLMGGTLPMISKFIIKKSEAIGRLVGNLYAINTFGAVLGILMAGYLLLPILGMRNLIGMAAVINIGIGVLCFLFDRHLTLLTGPDKIVKTEGDHKLKINYWGWIILIGFGLSGFTSMVYEVAWTRALALSIGSSIYAFSTMLITFIFGIGAGSLLFSLIWKERKISYHTFGFLEAGIGVIALLLIPFFDRLPSYFINLYSFYPDNYGFLAFSQFFLCFIIMIVPALLFGASFPIVSKIFVDDLKILSSRIGQAYAVNTLGCITGSFVVGFILVPIIGAQWSITLAALINLAVAVIILMNSRDMILPKKLLTTVVLLGVSSLLISTTKTWNKKVLNTGVTIHPSSYLTIRSFTSLEDFVRVRRLLFYREGINCNVAIIKVANQLSLNINGKSDASNGKDMATQLLGGYIPLILHSNPSDVYVLGLGSGVTLGACVQYGISNIECAEIEPAIIEAANFFSQENHNVIYNKRENIITADGRNYLLATKKKYDIITTEPSNPWMAGIANLFSKDFYEICKSKLKKNGLVCQWVQGYNLSPTDFQMIITTFRSVFPYVSIWSTVRVADYLLIGSMTDIPLDPEIIREKIGRSEIEQDLKSINIDSPFSFLSCLILSPNEVNNFVKGGMVNTDDLPLLEFSAPRSLYKETSVLNDTYLRSFQQNLYINLSSKERALINYYNGVHFVTSGFQNIAKFEFDKSISEDSTLTLAYINRGIINRNSGQILTALDDLSKALALDQDMARVRGALGTTYALQKKWQEAAKEYRKAIELDPSNLDYRLDLINLLVGSNQYIEAVSVCKEAIILDSSNAKLFEMLGFSNFILGDTAAAIRNLERSTLLDEFNSGAFAKLGSIYGAAGNNIKALSYLRQALSVDLLNTDIRLKIGIALIKLGRRKEAKTEFQKILRLDPDNYPAYYHLKSL